MSVRFIIFFLLLYCQASYAAVSNVTVDDEGSGISYDPADQWSQGRNCGSCRVKPDPGQMHGGTWHDTTYGPNPPVDGFTPTGPRSLSYTFTGTAVYMYCALFEFADLSFFIDGQLQGHFTFDAGENFRYNTPVFSRTGLSRGSHTITLQNGASDGSGNRLSLVLFDYLVYTQDDGQPAPQSSNSGGGSQQSNPNSQPNSQPSSQSNSQPGSQSNSQPNSQPNSQSNQPDSAQSNPKPSSSPQTAQNQPSVTQQAGSGPIAGSSESSSSSGIINPGSNGSLTGTAGSHASSTGSFMVTTLLQTISGPAGAIVTQVTTSVPVADSESSHEGSGVNAALIGAILGGVAVLVILLLIIGVFIWRRYRKRAKEHNQLPSPSIDRSEGLPRTRQVPRDNMSGAHEGLFANGTSRSDVHLVRSDAQMEEVLSETDSLRSVPFSTIPFRLANQRAVDGGPISLYSPPEDDTMLPPDYQDVVSSTRADAASSHNASSNAASSHRSNSISTSRHSLIRIPDTSSRAEKEQRFNVYSRTLPQPPIR